MLIPPLVPLAVAVMLKKGLHLYRTHVLVIESEKNVCLKKLVKSFIFLYRMLNLKSIL